MSRRKEFSRECSHCGQQFHRAYQLSLRRSLRRKFCSRECFSAHFARDEGEFLTRLWSRIDCRGPDECWPWRGRLNAAGYGVIDARNRPILAHRAVFFASSEAQDRSVTICHSCDNPSCCNPGHLWSGSQQQNIQDMIAKGRARRGIRRGSQASKTKLTEAQAMAAFVDARPNRAIARDYGVTAAAIYNIKAGKSWAHATGARRGENE